MNDAINEQQPAARDAQTPPAGEGETAELITRPRRATSRPRFASPPLVTTDEKGRPKRSMHSPDGVEREDAYQAAVERYEPQKEKSWFKRIAPLAFQGLALAGSGGDPIAAGGGAIAGAIYGAADARAGDRLWKRRALTGSAARRDQLQAREKARLDREEQQADIQVKNANRDWLRRRPEIEEGKRQSAAQKSEQQLVLSMLRLRKRPFDMSNPHDAAQIERAERAGVSADWDSFGLDTKNPYSVEVIDPEDPSGTRKTRMVYDRQSREWKPLGYQTNYVQPVNPETGMTPAQMDASADRKSGLQIRREALELSTAEYRCRLEAGLSTEAGRAFNIETKGQFEALRAIRSDIEDLKTRKAKAEIMPADAERRIAELEAKAARLGDGIEEAREKALAGMGSGGARTRSGAPAGSSSAPVKGRVSRAKFRGQNPRYKDASDAEIDTLLGARGLQGY